jgi:hypothetical protein
VDSFSQNSGEEIAWNGVRFLIPKEWQVAVIGKQYLLLEIDTGPVMEIKWNRIKGRFSHTNQLRRLASTQKKRAGKTLKKCPIPVGWKTALKNYESEAFVWHGKENISGKGVLLYCPSCHNATLIQFFLKGSSREDQIHQEILFSFKDHSKKSQINLKIFDIKALIPNNFRLLHHKFQTGKYELEFMSKKQKIILYRWGTASLILKNISLINFSNSIFSGPKDSPHSIAESDQSLNWSTEPSSTPGSRFLSRIKTKYPFQIFRVWHVTSSNAILAVNIKGKKQIDHDLFHRICYHYESV